MYTTLNVLKASEACVPGFTRMASFFGINTEVKEQKIPLHVVALVGGKEDALWTLNHGAIIDPEDFKKFYARHLVAVWKWLIYNELGRRNKSDKTKNKYLNRLIKEAYEVDTFEEVEAYLVKARSHRFSHALFNGVLDHELWKNPHSFIAHCFEIVRNVYSDGEPFGFKEDIFAPKDGEDPYNHPTNRPSRHHDDDEEGEVDEDEEERPRHRSSSTRRSAQPVRRADPDDIPDEDWIQKERPTIRLAYRTEYAQWLKSYPHANDSSSTRGNFYFIRTTRKEQTLSEDVAAMLCNEDDMYSFMATMRYKLPKGVKVTQATENKPAVMQCSFSDPKQMFTMVRLLTAKSSLSSDQNENDEEREW